MRTFLIVCSLLVISFAPGAKADLNVVTSIKPIHSLVSAVMEGAGSPTLLVKSAGSPHTYQMKPSEALALKNADIIFWVGKELETFLSKPIRTIGKKAKVITLHKIHGLKLLKFRESKTWGGDHHDDHHHGHHDHDEDAPDMHLWMDINNAKKIVDEAAMIFVAKDPKNAELYKKNAFEAKKKLDKLGTDLESILKPVASKPFIVFHDSYQYLEDYFKLKSAGAVTLNPEIQLGAKHLSELQKYIKTKNVKCIFTEPQFNAKTVKALKKRNKLGSAVLDPLGADLKDGPSLYFDMMTNNAKSIANCLSAQK